MANLNIDGFSDDFKDVAPKECAIYLYECFNDEDKKRIKEDWENAGGLECMPWWKWCMTHIDVHYNN